MLASISRAVGPSGTVNPTTAEEAIHNRRNGSTATVSESGSQASDSSTYDYYLHFTCPRCHHWLNKFPIKLVRDRSIHKRFQCPRCQHLLFGLGGNTTQTTLVSQETISRRGSGASAAESFHGCTDVRSLELSRDGNLKTIIEAGSSTGVSREPSQRSAVPREQSQPAKQPPQNQPPVLHTNGSSEGLSAAARGQPHSDKTATVPPDSGRLTKVKRHVNKVLRKVKDIKNHLRKPTSPGLGPFAKDRNAKVTTIVSAATLGKGASSTSKPTAGDLPMPSCGHRVPEQPQTGTRSSTAALNVGPNSTYGDRHDDQIESSQEGMSAANEKLERIRLIRREKKLRAKALQKPMCKCTDGCQCMQRETASRSSGEGQSRAVHPAEIEPHRFPHGVQSPEGTQTSSTIDSRRMSSDVSFEGRQQSPTRIEFAGIGDRFGESRHGSSQGMSGRVRPQSSLSQAPTAVSNESSISLLSGPAYFIRRPPNSRPQTPQLQVNHVGGFVDDEEGGGPTPTQHNINSQWTRASAEDERAEDTSSTSSGVVADGIRDRSLVNHVGALLPQSEDAE